MSKTANGFKMKERKQEDVGDLCANDVKSFGFLQKVVQNQKQVVEII